MKDIKIVLINLQTYLLFNPLLKFRTTSNLFLCLVYIIISNIAFLLLLCSMRWNYFYFFLFNIDLIFVLRTQNLFALERFFRTIRLSLLWWVHTCICFYYRIKFAAYSCLNNVVMRIKHLKSQHNLMNMKAWVKPDVFLRFDQSLILINDTNR